MSLPVFGGEGRGQLVRGWDLDLGEGYREIKGG